MGSVEKLRHKVEVLGGHCEAVGRGSAEIACRRGSKPIIFATPRPKTRRVWEAQMAHNRTPIDEVGPTTRIDPNPELVAERMIERRDLGFHTFLAEMAAPYDDETLERWIGEVKPIVDAA